MNLKNAGLIILMTLPLLASGSIEEAVTVDRLAWLSGCWVSDGGEAGSGEQWSKPGGGTMQGMSRFVRDGKTVAWEFVRIIENEAGSLTFIAAPSGQASHAFPLTSLGMHEVIFEDPEHDFPQRILYRLLEAGRLLGRIEGVSNGQIRAVDFPLTRTSCRD